MIEKITMGNRLEYFSREKREGWQVFGNDINKF
jgi:N6-adenosine-specific RNA methylase IME4